MTQNIQNGSFDINRGSRILRILLPFHPTRGGRHMGARSTPPPRFGPNLYAKNVIDVFYFKFLNLVCFFDICQNNYFVKKSISNYMLNLIA